MFVLQKYLQSCDKSLEPLIDINVLNSSFVCPYLFLKLLIIIGNALDENVFKFI